MECVTSNRVLMVRPATFFFNRETALNNSFQKTPSPSCDENEIRLRAISEFNRVVVLLQQAGVTVEIIEEESKPYASDSVFPNNWISFHYEKSDLTSHHHPSTSLSGSDLKAGRFLNKMVDKTVVLYPLWSKTRQVERRKLTPVALSVLSKDTTILDLSPLENQSRYLEGTGSLVLDRANRIAYACISPRTTRNAVELFCTRMGYKSVMFNGIDFTGKPCYHTNVMMSIADKYCIVCLDAIADLGERVNVEMTLMNSGKVVVPLTIEQVNDFAGNCLQLRGSAGTFLVMSSRAFGTLTEEQIDIIGQFDKILHADVPTIEMYGGGSVRCMIAEMGEAEEQKE